MFSVHKDGRHFALQQLGLQKTAKMGRRMANLLKREFYGDLAVRLPFQAGTGAISGVGVAHLTDQPLLSGAATGAATGALGGLTLAAVPAARRKLIELLSRGAR